MLTRVTSLNVVRPYGLNVRFNDGSGGTHDCTRLVENARGLVRQLADPDYFATVSLVEGAPTWPNSVDMDAEWLRREMSSAGELVANVAAE